LVSGKIPGIGSFGESLRTEETEDPKNEGRTWTWTSLKIIGGCRMVDESHNIQPQNPGNQGLV